MDPLQATEERLMHLQELEEASHRFLPAPWHSA